MTLAMLVFSAARALLYLRYPQTFSPLGGSQVAHALVRGLHFDAAILARLLGLPLLLMNLPLRWFDRRQWFDAWAWLSWLLVVLAAALLFADVLYFGHTQRHLSDEPLFLAAEWDTIRSYITAVYLPAVAYFVLFVLLLGVLWWRLLVRPLTPVGNYPLKFVVLVLVLGAAAWGGSKRPLSMADAEQEPLGAGRALVMNGVFSALAASTDQWGARHHFFSTHQALLLAQGERTADDPNFPLSRRFNAKPSGYNVVVVVLASWGYQFVDSFAGQGYGVTPEFDALARDGARFTHFFANGRRPQGAFQALLTGIPPLAGLPKLDGSSVHFTQLADLAAARDYQTLFFQGAPDDVFHTRNLLQAVGFSEIHSGGEYPARPEGRGEGSAPYGWDYEMYMYASQRLDRIQGPFLACLYTGTTRGPYPNPGASRLIRPHGASDENGYLNVLHYADWSLGRFMEAARQSDWYKRTVFVFVADRPTSLQAGPLPDRRRIPFLIYAPSLVQAGPVGVVGSQLDLLPTLVDLLGVDEPFTALGNSLLREHSGEAFLAMGGQGVGLVSQDGYVERYAGEGARLPGRDEAAARRLLALDQVSFDLLQRNRWAP